MSSDTRPYKSRLFNFINRQSLRWKDQRDRAFRRVKMTAEWGVQILLYPLYLLVQGGRSAGRAFGQTVERQKLRLQGTTPEANDGLAVDTPIQKILQVVNTTLTAQETPVTVLPTPQPALKLNANETHPALVQATAPLEAIADLSHSQDSSQNPAISPSASLEKKNPGKHKLMIQGVASLLEDKRLVLITLTNQILDLLSPQQQEHFQKRITWEIANYGRQRRLRRQTQQLPTRLPVHHPHNPHLFPPVRWFWKVMAWMQQGRIALSANLFNEATFVTTTPASDFSLIPSQLSLRLTAAETITRLDQTVATFEAQPFLPVEKLATTLRQETKKVIAKVHNNREVHPASKATTQSPRHYPSSPPKDPYSLQVLIRAALDYFFGRKKQPLQPHQTPISKLLPEDEPSPSALPNAQPNPSLPGQSSDDPWLSWEDLYGDTSPQATPDSPLPPYSLPSASLIPTQPQKTASKSIQQQLQQQQTPRALRKRSATTSSLRKIGKKSSNIQKNSRATRAVTKPEATTLTKRQPKEDYPLEANPDWLETEATPVGYVKHPLERILDWLDRIMVWFEELIVKVAQSLLGRS